MSQSPVQFMKLFKRVKWQRGALFGVLLLGALLAFEVFNYSTTDFALSDLLGADLRFMGIRWATVLSIAFCGIDFAGIARLFTPEKGRDEPAEVWYLFGAWVLAAAMNAILTWWGVSVAVLNQQSAGSALLGRETLLKAVPVFVAIMVWLIRILIIGTFSIAGERLFSQDDARPASQPRQQTVRPAAALLRPASSLPRPDPKPAPASTNVPRSEPSYHPVGLAASGREHPGNVRR